jgi:Asp/Glu/hydantoin racemase
MKTLAVIHTSMVFVTVEPMMQNLFKELIPDARLINILDDSLLPDVIAAGQVTRSVATRMCDYVVAAEKTGADAILSLCSSVGPAIDIARTRVNIPVIKIDDAMATRAAESAQTVGVMATLETTMAPTVRLIEEKADAASKAIAVTPGLVAGAFEKLMNGDKSAHDRMILDSARELAKSVDILVFAQASMARLADEVATETHREVLTSPRLGITYVRSALNGS